MFCILCLLSIRLRGSRVLLAGLGGLGAEVAKNLILAGVKELTLLDHEQVLHKKCLLIYYTFFCLAYCRTL